MAHYLITSSAREKDHYYDKKVIDYQPLLLYFIGEGREYHITDRQLPKR
jgi:hypothetical protein